MTRIALLGCGSIGRRVAQLLLSQDEHERDRIAPRFYEACTVSQILVRETSRDRGIDPQLLTDRFESVESDPHIDIAIETMGGVEPAREYVARLLERGVSVVTANKTMIAHHGQALHAIAQRHGVSLLYEASVTAALPLLSAIDAMRGDRLRSVRGVLNGASNFILTAMHQRSFSLPRAISEARQRGLCEPDPQADLSGRDTAEKLCIIAARLGIALEPQAVYVRGIESITADDVNAARRKGCVIKLVAELRGSIASVQPMLLPRDHALANVQGANNCVQLEYALAGQLLLHGAGAGPDPTASAILSDVLKIIEQRDQKRGQANYPEQRKSNLKSPSPTTPLSEGEGSNAVKATQRYYMRMPLDNGAARPRELLRILADCNVPLAEVEYARRQARVLTGPTQGAAVEHAIERVSGETPYRSKAFYASWLRRRQATAER